MRSGPLQKKKKKCQPLVYGVRGDLTEEIVWLKPKIMNKRQPGEEWGLRSREDKFPVSRKSMCKGLEK